MQRYIELESRLRRVMGVVKVRASPHSDELREFTIDGAGTTQYSDALASIFDAETHLMREIRHDLRLPGDEALDECLIRIQIKPTDRAKALLNDLDLLVASKATCKRLLGLDPSEEYNCELRVLTALQEVSPNDLSRILMRIAWVKKYAGNNQIRQGNEARAVQAFEDALEDYERATTLASDGLHDWDYSTRTGLAWCESGKLHCALAILNLEPWPAVQQHVERALREVIWLAYRLAEDEQRQFYRTLSRFYQAEDGSMDLHDALVEAATTLSRAIYSSVEDEDLSPFLDGLNSIIALESDPGPTILEDGDIRLAYQGSSPGLPTIGQGYGRQYDVFRAVVMLLGLLRQGSRGIGSRRASAEVSIGAQRRGLSATLPREFRCLKEFAAS